jgi:hypothetical protein
VAFAALFLLGASQDGFRYSRSIQAEPGFAVLELPVEVLSAAAPDLRDVRILSSDSEVAYAIEDRVSPAALRLPLVNVESVPGKETRALVDRGVAPGLADAISLQVAGVQPFLKPVVLEASDQREGFREIARGSIFRSGAAASLRLRFPPNDRRYLRVRLDDQLSEPLSPETVVFEQAPKERRNTRVIEAPCEPRTAEADSSSLCAVLLPSANLPATNIEFSVSDLVFQRRIRVFELIWFRNQLSRRLLVEGTIERTVNGQASVSLPVSDLRSNRLELEVERSGGALRLSAVRLTLSSKRLIFLAPEHGSLELLYGSPTAPAARYDLESVLRKGMPASFGPAILGPIVDRGERSTLPRLPRGAPLDTKTYRDKRSIQLPEQGPLAYLDVPGMAAQRVNGLRIVDSTQHQVPFVVEPTQIRERVKLGLSDERRELTTSARITGIDRDEVLALLELRASAPALFQRQVRVYESIRDKRGQRGRQLLGEARWERRLEDTSARLRLALSPGPSDELVIEIDNADNPPVQLSEVAGEVVRTRIDFLFTPGESLWLLHDPGSTRPNYDLALLSEWLFATPAYQATLGPRELVIATSGGTRPAWFWAAFVAAAGLLLAVLARLLRGGGRAE